MLCIYSYNCALKGWANVIFCPEPGHHAKKKKDAYRIKSGGFMPGQRSSDTNRKCKAGLQALVTTQIFTSDGD
jgi:hypothetical protein